MTRIILSIISIILCTAALSASTYAWYLLSITSGTNTVTTGDYELSGSFMTYNIAAKMSTGGSTTIENIADGIYTNDNNNDNRLHLAPASGSYATGYAILTFKDTSATPREAVYYVPVGTGKDLSITIPDTSNLKIEAHWGVPAKFGVAAEQIVSADSLTVSY